VVVGAGTKLARARKIPAPSFPSRGGLSEWKNDTYFLDSPDKDDARQGKVQVIPGYFQSKRKLPVTGDLAFSNDHKQKPIRLPSGRAARDAARGISVRHSRHSLPAFLSPTIRESSAYSGRVRAAFHGFHGADLHHSGMHGPARAAETGTRSRSVMSGQQQTQSHALQRSRSADLTDLTDPANPDPSRPRLPILLASGRARLSPADREELLRPVPAFSPSPNRVISIRDSAGNAVSYRLPLYNRAPPDPAAAAAAAAADRPSEDGDAAAAASWQQQALRALAAESLFKGLRPAVLQVRIEREREREREREG
jgi:hypothetical protein